MQARFFVLTALMSGVLFWTSAAHSGAPEPMDMGIGFGTVEEPEPIAEIDVPVVVSPVVATQSTSEPGPASPIPVAEIQPFKAVYDVKMKGVVVGELEVSLAKTEGDEWEYRQKSATKGVASLFGPEDLVETSRFRLLGEGPQVLEYRSKRKGGDADDNARFVFDHSAARVDSVGKGAPWSVDAPKGVVDPLLMTLAMRFDLAAAEEAAAETYLYDVPRQGRIKTYEFGVAGVERLEVMGRSISTVHVQRLRDKKDQTSIWTAPEMEYLPVRILKTRKEGSSSEVVLRSFSRR